MLGGVCGRITLTRPDLEHIASELAAQFESGGRGSLHAALQRGAVELLWLLVAGDDGERRIVPAVWGLPSQRAKRPPINIQAETLRRGAFKSRRRSVVIGDGFYEWTGGKGARRPLWFHRGSELMLFAAVDTPLDASTRAPLACAVITVEPGADVAAVHNRQPALLEADQLGVWFGADDAARLALLAPSPAGALEARAVSPRVNDVANDDPTCVAPWEAPPPAQASERHRPRQLSLLDDDR